MSLEIERKFLLRPCSPRKFLNSLDIEYRVDSIEQYYLPTEEYIYIRYRKIGSDFFKTIKSGDGMIRNEDEYRVTKDEYLEHHAKHIGRVIEKDRFTFIYNKTKYELDRFKKDLKGLCYLEIEFGNENEAENFVLPDIFSTIYIAEVTNDNRFNNASLSKPGNIPTIHTDLEKLLRKVKIVLPSEINEFPLLIEPFESTETAILAIFQNRLNIIRDTRQQLKDDIDSREKLHNFWIAMRRTRALIGEFDSCFTTNWSSLHKRNISMLMAQTNSKRDIDTFLDKIDYYRVNLSTENQENLNLIKKILEEKNRSLKMKVMGLLDSELLNYEISSLGRPVMVDEKTLLQPMIISSMHILQKHIEEILREGKDLDFSSKSQSLYRMRIQFKNLCCFIEDTKPFILNKKYNKTILLIKNMERLLGDYHDLEFQRLFLIKLSKEVDSSMIKTIQKLRKIIFTIQKKVENLFQVEYKQFIKEEKQLKQLFKC
jgi:CYTH domain-containing protein/CHAD domain-containing protein